MLPFIRQDLAQLSAYQPHPGSPANQPQSSPVDKLDTNESPFDLPHELKQKLAWTYEQVIAANRYPDGDHQQLKMAIAEYVNESAGLSSPLFDQAHISVGNGSDELIRSLLIASCLQGEGATLVANPTFSMYAILAQTLGIPVANVGRSPINFEIDLDAADLAIKQTQNPPIRVVFVVNPNSPTGNALTASELAWLFNLPESILVVIDEAYFEFSQQTVIRELLQRQNWVVLRTFSKAFRLAAHRVGYAIAAPELIAALEKVRLPYNLPSFSQAAAILALQQRQLLLPVIGELLTERDKLIRALAQHPELQTYESAANFVFVKLKNSDEEQLSYLNQQLQASGTLVRQISGGLRLTIGTPEENERTRERLQLALAKLN